MDLTLLIMAAGLGSRFGGWKQVEKIGKQNASLLDFSIFDAIKAGFNRFVIIVNSKNESLIDDLESVKYLKKQKLNVIKIEQNTKDLPGKFECPANRTKPWGTAHAVWVARNQINTPFVAINADDFYGSQAFEMIAKFFKESKGLKKNATVLYLLKNTLSPFGPVSRAICSLDENKTELADVQEFTQIEKIGSTIKARSRNESVNFSGHELVSLNFWGFFPEKIFPFLESQFENFIEKNLHSETAEFYLPSVVNSILNDFKKSSNASFGINEKSRLDEFEKNDRTDRLNSDNSFVVLESESNWLGMTYKEDKVWVENSITKLDYPDKLF